MPPSSACEQEYQQSPVTFFSQSLVIGRLPKGMALFCRKPIPQAYTQLVDAFDPANTGSRVRAEQAAIRGFVRESAHRTEA